MQLDEFLQILPGKHKRTINGYLCHCPAHNDSTPSLSVKEKDGKILVKCHAGCKFDDIIMALRLRPSDMFTNPPEKTNGAVNTGGLINRNEVARYEYYALNGEESVLLGWKCRYEPKSFAWFTADGKPGRPKEKVLYNYPHMVENFKDVVYIVEGEKDVETLKSVGAVAVCSGGGSSEWEDSYSEVLSGATVKIIPDNDIPGLKFGIKVYESLKKAGVTATLHPLTKFADIKDVSDWHKKKKITLKKLSEVAAKTPAAVKKMIKDKESIEKSHKETEANMVERVSSWLEDVSGNFGLVEAYHEADAHTRPEKRAVRAYLNLLATEGHITKDRGKNGRFCKPESELEHMDWESATGERSKLWLPLDIHNMVDIMPRSIIVVAGYGNAGKTKFSLVAGAGNVDNFDVRYFNSEMSEDELKRRVHYEFDENGINALRRMKFYRRSSNFHEVIRPNSLNIVDFLEIHTDFFAAGEQFKQIHDALENGICIINIQRRRKFGYQDRENEITNNDFGVGGEATAEKARLYLAMSYGKIKIVKAKLWPQNMPNPNGMEIDFEYRNGVYQRKTNAVGACNTDRWSK